MVHMDLSRLSDFVNEFSPGAIFSERIASRRFSWLENLVRFVTDTLFFASTGGDEYSLKQLKLSLAF